MSMMDEFMGKMMGGMKPEEKESMMEKMMEKFFQDMKPEEKQKIMENMMSKMMGGMMGGKKEEGRSTMPGAETRENFKPWEFCPCRNLCEKGFATESEKEKKG